MSCPLCLSNDSSLFFEDRRTFYRCCDCKLIFISPSQYPSAEKEKEIYDLHENDSEDFGYRKFLSRLTTPLLKVIAPKSQGLDFGCGPGPTLSKMLEEQGMTVDLYDKYYFDNPEALNKKYDFITATEVVEHLFEPGKEISRLIQLLNKGGQLAIMTKLARDKDAFSTWHYKNDLTHVCFFSKETFLWLSEKHSLDVQFFGNDVIMLSVLP